MISFPIQPFGPCHQAFTKESSLRNLQFLVAKELSKQAEGERVVPPPQDDQSPKLEKDLNKLKGNHTPNIK